MSTALKVVGEEAILKESNLVRSGPSFQPKWIMTRNKDLFWFIGSAGFGYAFLLLYSVAHVSLAILIPIWAIVFDETHNFATISRTYFDKEELKRRGRLLWWSIAAFIVAGPAIIAAGLGDVLEIVTSLWAYYHLVKQHYGFMSMYKKKNNDVQPIDNWMDRWFFYIACWYPFMTLPFHEQDSRELVFSPFFSDANNLPAYMNKIVSVYQTGFFIILLLVTAIYLIRQIVKLKEGLPINIPKLTLFAAVLSLHYITLRYQEVAGALNHSLGLNVQMAPLGAIGVVAVLTIYHNVQYHGIVWYYNHKRYRVPDAKKKYGFAGIVNTRVQYYIAFALLYAFMFDVVPRFVLPNFLGRQSPGWNNTDFTNQMVAYMFAWPGLLHYLLDGKIWKLRRDPEVSRTLNLNAA
ncbi:MAG TPA: hypothetical protein VFC63_26840 [Blastocatellia bacterium]|nr:hypothetical protein [Blastocatellia bacterium]